MVHQITYVVHVVPMCGSFVACGQGQGSSRCRPGQPVVWTSSEDTILHMEAVEPPTGLQEPASQALVVCTARKVSACTLEEPCLQLSETTHMQCSTLQSYATGAC